MHAKSLHVVATVEMGMHEDAWYPQQARGRKYARKRGSMCVQVVPETLVLPEWPGKLVSG